MVSTVLENQVLIYLFSKVDSLDPLVRRLEGETHLGQDCRSSRNHEVWLQTEDELSSANTLKPKPKRGTGAPFPRARRMAGLPFGDDTRRFPGPLGNARPPPRGE